MKSQLLIISSVIIVVVQMATGVHGSISYYNCRAAFNAAAGPGLSFESFETNPQSGPSVTYGGLTFTESEGAYKWFYHTAITDDTYYWNFPAATTDGQYSIWYYDNVPSTATLTFSTPLPVSALGFDITSRTDMEVLIGGDVISSVILSPNTPVFWGAISTTPITTLTFNTSVEGYVGFDAVAYGSREIPEPTSLAIWSAIALGGLGLAYRRRRKQAA